MISMQELNPHNYATDATTADNLNKLLSVMNQIRAAYGKPMTVNSGLRSQADQDRINPKAPKSNHLKGLACDIADADAALWAWCMVNMPLMEKLGVYFEDKNASPTWVHFQIVAPASGKRIFKP